MNIKNIFKNFITFAEDSGRRWKKRNILIYNVLSFLATIGFFINISKAENTKSLLLNLIILPFVFLALFQGAIMKRISKERK